MDATSLSSSLFASTEKTQWRSRQPLSKVGPAVYMPSLRNSSCNAPSFRQTGDRFIPDTSAMDFDVAYYLLTQPRKEKENNEVVSPAKEAYRKILAQTFLNNRSRILVFCKKPPTAMEGMLTLLYDSASSNQSKVARTKRYIPQVKHPEVALFLGGRMYDCVQVQ